ncbi:hypothetical protein [Jiulongibacter sediminis]|jgi:predicted metal-dependent hydrolase|uniref:hypothetical protein n=1 Tax=Jiulongibacter sediminis TaxID=1605367 RepID=UPI00103B4F30|nr:hypothetical protein [Jiulongibacter sediminis]
MLLSILVLFLLIGWLAFALHAFDSSLPDRTNNYYEMKEFHWQNAGLRKGRFKIPSYLRFW